MERIQEVVELYLEVEGIPVEALNFVDVQQITAAA